MNNKENSKTEEISKAQALAPSSASVVQTEKVTAVDYSMPPHVELMIIGTILTTIVVSLINNIWQNRRQNKQFEHDLIKHREELESEYNKQDALFKHERGLNESALMREKRDLLFHSLQSYINNYNTVFIQLTLNSASINEIDATDKVSKVYEQLELQELENNLYINNYFCLLKDDLENLEELGSKVWSIYNSNKSNQSKNNIINELKQANCNFRASAKLLLSKVVKVLD